MSDVSKTIPELIEEARGFWGSETREYTEGLVSRLADALEATNMLREPGDAATAAIERVRALHQAAWDSVSAMYPTPLCGCGEEFNECPTAQVLPPSSASNAAGLNHEGTAP